MYYTLGISYRKVAVYSIYMSYSEYLQVKDVEITLALYNKYIFLNIKNWKIVRQGMLLH